METKNVVITGAASGIGKATAIRFAREGYNIGANDIREEELETLFAGLPAGDHILLPGSYHEVQNVKRFDALIRSRWGRVDALVNCAGISEQTDPIEMDLSRWRVTFDAMVNGCFLMTQLAVKLMSGGGRIVHITSIHGMRAEKCSSAYSMAKAAINQYCRSMALELAGRNILVNAIAPGFVNTPMSAASGENELETQWFKDNYVHGGHLPLRRAAEADEVAGVCFFLAGKDASYITGQVITVDGGLCITF